MYILADVGGTKTRLAGSRDLASFDEPIIIDTEQEYDRALERMVETAGVIARGALIERFMVGMTGVISDEGHSATAPHLPLWKGKHLSLDLEKLLSTKVFLENDTALVGLGEAHHGAGRNSAIMCYITISTGVNGVRITNGVIDKTAGGFEIGGTYLSHDPAQTFEDLVSGTAITKREGVHPRDLGHDWAGWEDLARLTAFGVHNAIAHWSPERVILGGSMMKEIGIPIDRVRAHLERINVKYPSIPEIVHAELGDVGGIWGGIARLRQLG